MKIGFILPDQHFPLHDKKAFSVILQALDIIRPSVFINLGDVGEWESVSAWQWKGKKQPPLEYQLPIINKEIKVVNKYIDQIDEKLEEIGCNEKYMLEGNHDQWLDKFVEKYPYMKHYTFERACFIKKRGYKYFEHNVPLKIGKLHFIHGAYVGGNHAKKTLESFGVNIVYGHTHDIMRYNIARLEDGAISAWSLGCIKDLSLAKNKWLKGKPNNWQHCFGVVYFYSNGEFVLNVIDIVNGRSSVWGQTIVSKGKA